MTWQEIVVAILGAGGLLGAIVSWRTTRHRPEVDRAEVVITGQGSLIDDIREERDRLDRRIDEVGQQALAAEQRALSADRRATEAEQLAAQALAQESAAIDHHLDVVRRVHAGEIPPWRHAVAAIPAILRDRLSPADYPTDYDNGVPGTEETTT